MSENEGAFHPDIVERQDSFGKAPSVWPYVETIQGVQWLKRCRANKIREKSPSFDKLAAALEKVQCWWLESAIV